MPLARLSVNKLDHDILDKMLSAMHELLEGHPNAQLTLDALCAFQDEDGSFKLLDSYEVPKEARVDYCHMPTYLGAAILMKAFLGGVEGLSKPLEKALAASAKSGLAGHGYDSEHVRIDALRVFIKGGLQQFLENHRTLCPEFHNLVHNILHEYHSCLLRNDTKGPWGEDYASDWKAVADQLKLKKRLYIAYGSNMDKVQMAVRCPNAQVAGKAYIEGWELTMPFYANIERAEGKRTPALIWEISRGDEKKLDRYEGYPDCYDKVDILVNIEGTRVSAMAYVMTEEYKKKARKPRSGYVEQILHGYREAGFSEDEFRPRE